MRALRQLMLSGVSTALLYLCLRGDPDATQGSDRSPSPPKSELELKCDRLPWPERLFGSDRWHRPLTLSERVTVKPSAGALDHSQSAPRRLRRAVGGERWLELARGPLSWAWPRYCALRMCCRGVTGRAPTSCERRGAARHRMGGAPEQPWPSVGASPWPCCGGVTDPRRRAASRRLRRGQKTARAAAGAPTGAAHLASACGVATPDPPQPLLLSLCPSSPPPRAPIIPPVGSATRVVAARLYRTPALSPPDCRRRAGGVARPPRG